MGIQWGWHGYAMGPTENPKEMQWEPIGDPEEMQWGAPMGILRKCIWETDGGP